MLSIQLLHLRFYAYHGIHKEEARMGAEYEVNVTVHHREQKIPVMHINETIDYVSVYGLLQKHMSEARPLLETVATTFLADVFSSFPLAEEASVTIIKKHPPIAAFEGSVAVTYSAVRGDQTTKVSG